MDGDDVEVYVADVGWLQDRHVTLVDSVESARASQLRRSGDRRRFLAGAVLLRLAVANRLGAQPADLLLDRRCRVCGGPHGLPRIPGGPLQVSVTHSADRVGVALSTRGPVGLDLERITRIDIAELLPLVLAAGERDRVSTLTQFYRLWVAKEAALKAIGVGLRVPMASVTLTPFDTATRRALLSDQPYVVVTVTDLEIGAGYAAAVALQQHGDESHPPTSAAPELEVPALSIRLGSRDDMLALLGDF